MADLALFAFERLRERIEVGDDIAQRTLFANHQIIDVACNRGHVVDRRIQSGAVVGQDRIEVVERNGQS